MVTYDLALIIFDTAVASATLSIVTSAFADFTVGAISTAVAIADTPDSWGAAADGSLLTLAMTR